MAIYIENESRVVFDFKSVDSTVKKAIKAVFQDKNLPEELDVNVLITTSKSIRTINWENRNVDSVTDVLSFPYYDYEEPGVFLEEILEDEENILGDIIICASKIKEQAKKYGHSQKRELAFLIVHSMLHLIGYDHMEEKDAELMQAEERRIMEIINIKR
ncbi:MAG: rRNA maturation RNase YbeY [Lachnospiraceae bacterium]|nr:rRNA maturation RNase YbeY [Lachnospiraceae bacterium]